MWITLAVVAAAAAALCLVPFRVELRVEKRADQPAVRVHARLRWLLLSWRLGESSPGAAGQSPAQASKVAAGVRRPPSAATRRRRLAAARRALATPGFLGRCLRLVREVSRRALPDATRIEATVGFEDPADTGMFVGAMYAAQLPGQHGPWQVRIEPDFSGATFAGVVDAQWSRSLAGLAWPFVRFLTSPPVLRALRAWRAARINTT